MVHFQKKRKTQEAHADVAADDISQFGDKVLIKFADAQGTDVGNDVEVPLDTTREELVDVLKSSLSDEDRLEHYSLVLVDKGLEVLKTLKETFLQALKKGVDVSTEETLKITFYSEAPFRVRPVSRLAGSLRGHTGTILCLAFSADGLMMATGSGDCEVRLWDLATVTPICTLKGHTRPVSCVAWSADGKWLASGSEDHTIRIWEAQKCNTTRVTEPRVLSRHKDTITYLDFMPMHLHKYWQHEAPLLLSAARDGSIKVWNPVQGNVESHLDGHLKMVTSARWSGMDKGVFNGEEMEGPFVYSSSRDMTVKVWDVRKGVPLRTIKCHGHWVNALSCNTDGIMRYGPFDRTGASAFAGYSSMVEAAERNWKEGFKGLGEELVVTCSDDNTLALWNLLKSDQKIAHMTGHQKAVCQACFSPNGRYILSAGFDSAIRLWDGRTGKFLHTYRGHVGPVYQLSWAADSRLFVSCSKDSTLKVWDTHEGARKLKEDLPGAADEIYTVQWSPDCARVASGGKDKIVRIWCH